MQVDTIFALSSGAPPAGVAVIRVSGPGAMNAAVVLAGRRPEAHRVDVVAFRDPATGETIDRGLLLGFVAPSSFTGEDVVEFQVHGGRAVIAAMLDALGRLPGLRLAQAGEFTKRAFLNGRMDLTEAEGLADLVAAETEAQRRQALGQARGELRAAYDAWRARLMHARALCEAEIDFSDEDGVEDAWPMARGLVAELYREMSVALARRAGERIRDGFVVVLLGAPNAGKSSLLNALVQRDAAIVAAEPGTTRDLIEVDLDVAGLPVKLVDTAGLRSDGGAVEREGMRRALARAAQADLSLWLSEDLRMTVSPGEIGAPVLRIATKADLFDSEAERMSSAGADVVVSAHSGRGLDTLLGRIAEYLPNVRPDQAPTLITRARHREALARAQAALSAIVADRHLSLELAAEELRVATDAIGRITGKVDVEGLLDIVFRDFCIGK